MEKLALVFAGGVIAITSAMIGQYVIYLKELKFKRMEKIEIIVDELHKLSHAAHSMKIGNFEKMPSSIEDKKFLTIGKIYFSDVATQLDLVHNLWQELLGHLIKKSEKNFGSTILRLDKEIQVLISELKP